MITDDSSVTGSSSDEKMRNGVVYVKPSSSAISRFLNYPEPLSKIPTKQIKPAGGVITSANYIREMERLRTLKKEKEEEKKRKKEERERKKEKSMLYM